jgi:hypothetical protein
MCKHWGGLFERRDIENRTGTIANHPMLLKKQIRGKPSMDGLVSRVLEYPPENVLLTAVSIRR